MMDNLNSHYRSKNHAREIKCLKEKTPWSYHFGGIYPADFLISDERIIDDKYVVYKSSRFSLPYSGQNQSYLRFYHKPGFLLELEGYMVLKLCKNRVAMHTQM